MKMNVMILLLKRNENCPRMLKLWTAIGNRTAKTVLGLMGRILTIIPLTGSVSVPVPCSVTPP